MSNADRERWNQKYAHRGGSLSEVPLVLLQNLTYFQKGTVLDVASGDGGVALYLASKAEFTVSALDISDIALKRLSAFALEGGLNVDTFCVDLDEPQLWPSLGSFDNICLFRYKPTKALIECLTLLLAPNGRLIISTFNQRHHKDTGFNQQFCLQANELLDVNDQLALVSHHSSEQSPFCDSYIFEKN